MQYAKDCQTLFGKTIDAPLHHGLGKRHEKSAQLWESRYADEPYWLDLTAFGDTTSSHETKDVPLHTTEEQEDTPYLEYDLADAVTRQRSFFYQVR